MIKCIVCDLDETLLDNSKTISKENCNAIKRVTSMGIKFVFATGRGYTSIQHYLEVLDLQKASEYAITNNGAIITENENNRILSFHTLPWNLVEAILNFGLQYDVCIQVFLPEDVYAFNCGDDERDMLLSFKKDAILVDGNEYSFLKDATVVKLMLQHSDYLYLQSLEEKIDGAIKENTTISYSSNRYMEFNTKGISKATGIVELCNILNISLDEVLAIGDNMNDYEMLKLVPNSGAVSNAVDAVKGVCTYVSAYSNNESAILDIIGYFLDKKW